MQGDVRRDSGFSIYYMGINVGAFISPFVVGGLAQLPAFQRFLESVGLSAESSWHFGFAMAALGMLFGLVWYVRGGKYLGDRGLHPVPAESPEAAQKLKRNTTIAVVGIVGGLMLLVALAAMGVITITPEGVARVVGVGLLFIIVGFFSWLFLASEWTKEERKRLWLILVLFVASAVFWSAFEQAGSSLNLFAQNDTRNYFPASWFQSANALFIIFLTPLFAWLWVWLAQRRRDPSTPAKFSFGLILVGAGFLVMMVAASLSAGGSQSESHVAHRDVLPAHRGRADPQSRRPERHDQAGPPADCRHGNGRLVHGHLRRKLHRRYRGRPVCVLYSVAGIWRGGGILHWGGAAPGAPGSAHAAVAAVVATY